MMHGTYVAGFYGLLDRHDVASDGFFDTKALAMDGHGDFFLNCTQFNL